ncbi:MAG: thioesterase family protein, partial [Paracoccaceae bacterium]
DVDPWRELNNGRVLTLYDLGRVVLFIRLGFLPVLRCRGWAGTIAGVSIRYRRRVRACDRYELRSRMIGWDDRFFYAEQSMWRHGDCASHGLLRMAITSADGLVAAPEAARALAEAEAVLAMPEAAALFGADALAEAALTAPVDTREGRLTGRADRVVIGASEVLVVDFKTDRAVPGTPAAVSAGYRAQLGAYAAALGAIYPDRAVRPAILWTAAPRLMALAADDCLAAWRTALDGLT